MSCPPPQKKGREPPGASLKGGLKFVLEVIVTLTVECYNLFYSKVENGFSWF